MTSESSANAKTCGGLAAYSKVVARGCITWQQRQQEDQTRRRSNLEGAQFTSYDLESDTLLLRVVENTAPWFWLEVSLHMKDVNQCNAQFKSAPRYIQAFRANASDMKFQVSARGRITGRDGRNNGPGYEVRGACFTNYHMARNDVLYMTIIEKNVPEFYIAIDLPISNMHRYIEAFMKETKDDDAGKEE